VQEIGHKAAESLVRQIDEEQQETTLTLLPGSLVVRDSVGPGPCQTAG